MTHCMTHYLALLSANMEINTHTPKLRHDRYVLNKQPVNFFKGSAVIHNRYVDNNIKYPYILRARVSLKSVTIYIHVYSC